MKNYKEKDMELSPLKAGWIDYKRIDDLSDEDIKKIFMFYIVNTPCEDISYCSISFQKYGWEKNVWQKRDLRNRLLSVANLIDDKTFFKSKKLKDMKKIFEKANMKKNFNRIWNEEKIAMYKPNKYNDFMSILYHIRNSLAHGRFAIYNGQNEMMFVLEDGKKVGGKLQVRSRMVLKKTTLLKWIDIITKKDINE